MQGKGDFNQGQSKSHGEGAAETDFKGVTVVQLSWGAGGDQDEALWGECAGTQSKRGLFSARLLNSLKPFDRNVVLENVYVIIIIFVFAKKD